MRLIIRTDNLNLSSSYPAPEPEKLKCLQFLLHTG
jgi:hypothetical protein